MTQDILSSSRKSFSESLVAWTNILGDKGVAVDDEIRLRYARTTGLAGRMPVAVLWPESVDDVIEIVRVARLGRIPLYPISRGRNWGYGDACAVRDGQAIVDLGRMNRIIEIRDDLAYAVIEPGVTQIQLADALRAGGHRLWLDCTGAGPDASVIGNILERGIGHTNYGVRDRFVSGVEVVLGDGRLLRTGFGHYNSATATQLYPAGIGPSLDGLFGQSNFGIVVRMGIWLMPQPECFNLFVAFVPREEDVFALIDALRPLKLGGTIRSVAHIANDLRLITGATSYPWREAGEVTPLPAELRARLRRNARIGAWGVSAGLYGTKAQVKAMRRDIARALGRRGWMLRFFDARDVACGHIAARLLGGTAAGRRLRRRFDTIELVFGLHTGIPTRRFLAGAYWRRRNGLPEAFPEAADPAADNCGLYWISPVLPMSGVAAREVLGIVAPIFAAHRFDLPVTFSMVSDRALGAVLTIAYDRDDTDETRRASECHEAAIAALLKAGYIPYRVGIDTMAALDRGSDVFWDVVGALKGALDPDGIIAPGRYDPAGARGER